MACKLLNLSVLRKQVIFAKCLKFRNYCTNRSIIGNREIVTFGINGLPGYYDTEAYPFPSIRWMETTPDVADLKQKEKGNWHKLSIDEKKCLYRISFRETFAEFQAPKGEWKSIVGLGFVLISLGIWTFYMLYALVYSKIPESHGFSEDSQRAQLRRMLDIEVNNITGISSRWDYDRNCWKK